MEAFDPQAFDVFKMPTIIGKESQIVPQRGSGDQEIQIAVERLSSMSRFSFSPSTSPTQPPAVRDNQSVRDWEGAKVMVKVTSSPSATSKGSSGSNTPP